MRWVKEQEERQEAAAREERRREEIEHKYRLERESQKRIGSAIERVLNIVLEAQVHYSVEESVRRAARDLVMDSLKIMRG